METTKITHIAHLVEICAQAGIKQIVLSPGSRNAPLVIAFDAHPKIETFVVHDERSAAFFALGLAESSHLPVAICCTSGSAPINYGPAIAEAYYRNIPLLVLTADRPTKWIDQGDGQTIRQTGMFNNYIKAAYDLPDVIDLVTQKKSDELVTNAMASLFHQPKGPIHINIPLAEPLYEYQNLNLIPKFELKEERGIQVSAELQDLVRENWNKFEKKLLIIGQLDPTSIDIIRFKKLLEDPSLAILVENTSNLQDFERICHSIDRTLSIISPDELEEMAPELLISMGGAIISKRIKAYFRKFKAKMNWRVGQFLINEDTFESKTHDFNVPIDQFLKIFDTIEIIPPSNYGNRWKQKDFIAQTIHEEFLNTLSFSDLKAFDIVLDTIPDQAILHMGNSSVVRYCQLFNPIPSITYFGNRGVSGIDGSTSTAAGYALNTSKQLNIIISGDTSFFYDSNALWNSYLGSNFRIIVINNGGGGIFDIIDGPSKSKQKGYFIAPFKAKIEHLCRAFDVNYFKANDQLSLENVMESFYAHQSNDRPALLEVDTQGIENAEMLKLYFEEIRGFNTKC